METTIKMARACKNSAELFAMAESLSQALSDSEAGLAMAEASYNWESISHYVGLVAHWKYLYKTIYGWASDMEEQEHELELSREYHDAIMGDRI